MAAEPLLIWNTPFTHLIGAQEVRDHKMRKRQVSAGPGGFKNSPKGPFPA